ncbi:hypothetical protein XhyaCFBP1156_17990 [Xanthomonas hyacinthi]|uniref:Uncharacterized protein n=2 Tax=Xanthomonas hyacinthi TaxID=56455 RepID=A0A2S7ERD1_9XANT|nr:hypothetical protein XhyaCFBP1156_17990 [Xanthomonas hyacinthi]
MLDCSGASPQFAGRYRSAPTIEEFFMSIFSSIGHAFEHVGNAIGGAIVGAGKDLVGAAEHAGKSVGDVCCGDFGGALKQLGQAGQGVVDAGKYELQAGVSLVTAVPTIAAESVANAHLNPLLTKIAGGAKSVLDDTRQGVTQAYDNFADSGVGLVSGGLNCVDDALHGRVDALGMDAAKMAGNVFNVAECLTPEGAVAAVTAGIAGAALSGTGLGAAGQVIGDAVTGNPWRVLRDGATTMATGVVDPLLQKDFAGDSQSMQPQQPLACDAVGDAFQAGSDTAIGIDMPVGADFSSQCPTANGMGCSDSLALSATDGLDCGADNAVADTDGQSDSSAPVDVFASLPAYATATPRVATQLSA